MSPKAVTASPADIEPSARPAFVRHAKLIGLFTLASRILGLLRQIVAGHYLGTGMVASAFSVAFTVPNLFRKLFGEGALSAAFIPLYAQAVKKHGGVIDDRSASQLSADFPISPADFAAASVNLLCLILVGITLVGEAALGAILLLDPTVRDDRLLMLRLTAIMLPYVLLICGGAFLSGILQVHRRFGPPAAAPLILNICHIGVVFIGARMLGLRRGLDPQRLIAKQTTLVYWLAGFVLVAGVLQVAILLPALRDVGFRFRLTVRIWTPAVRKMLRLTLPVALGAGVLQASVLLDKAISAVLMQGYEQGRIVQTFHLAGREFRYPMEIGAVARLENAQFLYQFPLGVFAIALATAIFPSLSADALDKDRKQFCASLRHGIEATLWEGLAASAGLILVREPTVRLLFQHGLIRAHDAELIARSVLWYSGAIWAFSLLQIVNRAYYAVHDTWTPLTMSVLNIALNLIVELPLVWLPSLGESGMAVGTLVSFTIQAIWMLWLLDRKIGGLDLHRLGVPILKMITATLLMIAACLLLKHSALYPVGLGRMDWGKQLLMLMFTGAAVYLGACAAMRLKIMWDIFGRHNTPRE